MNLLRVDITNSYSASKDKAFLDIMLADKSREIYAKKKPLVLICPGGGYEFCSDREADMIAFSFLSMGYHAAILRYTCAPDGYFPASIIELATSVKYIRDNAEELGVIPNMIITCGFSAGAHLAATLGCYYNSRWLMDATCFKAEDMRPNAQIICYPVITSGEYAHRGSFEHLLGTKCNDEEMLDRFSLEKHVTKDTPKTFLWHTVGDNCVPIQNSMFFFNALIEAGVSVEYHVFELGGHGLGLANKTVGFEKEMNCDVPETAKWIKLCENWLGNFTKDMYK